MNVRVLHIGEADKFTLPMWKVMAEHIGLDGHVMLYRKAHFPAPFPDGFVTGSPLRWTSTFIKLANRADRIMLHGLFDPRVFVALCLQPWLLRKCYWWIWGGDLYTTLTDRMTPKLRIRELFKRFIIRRLGFLVTYVRGDVTLARELYKAEGKEVECLLYPSNIVDAAKLPVMPKGAVTRVLVGNSADDSNAHAAIFDKLVALDDGKFEVVCPLSYGDDRYRQTVLERGRKAFGERFQPILTMMPYDDYLAMLAGVDIAVFAHKRQQAMGVTISLLGMGKRVFIRDDVPQWETFRALGLQVSAYQTLELTPMDTQAAGGNQRLVAEYFSTERLVSQLRNVFGT